MSHTRRAARPPVPPLLSPELSRLLPATDLSIYELIGRVNSRPLQLNEIVRVIRQEPALAAQVLRAAGLESPQPPDTLESCAVLLGAARLQELAVAVPIFCATHPAATVITPLLQYACLCGTLTERITIECGYHQIEHAYLAGLLHDIGRLAYAWRAVGASGTCPPANSLSNDTALFAAQGTTLARTWRFPVPVQEAIEHHLRPEHAQDHLPVVRAVALAQAFCERMRNAGAAPAVSDALGCFELVKEHLPLLPVQRQAVLTELLIMDYKRWNERGRSGRASVPVRGWFALAYEPDKHPTRE